MANIYLGLGSNRDRSRNLRSGLESLEALGDELMLSPVYESPAVGFVGSPFFNLVVGMVTELSVASLNRALKKIEAAHGRDPDGPRFGPVPLDIDLLLYDNLVGEHDGVLLPRPEILRNAFVLLPLSDIAPDVEHPVAQQTFRALWHEYDKSQQEIWHAAL